MNRPKHSAIINSVANQILKPAGLIRKGASRMWLDDQGWYTTIVDFQPHPKIQGTFLNVGVHFHWYLSDHWSFDIGERESAFIPFQEEHAFTVEIQRLAQKAYHKVIHFREVLQNIQCAKRTLLCYPFLKNNLWGNYHLGMICGLTGDSERLVHFFNELLQYPQDSLWASELKSRVADLKIISRDRNAFVKHIQNIIQSSRNLKKLCPAELSSFHLINGLDAHATSSNESFSVNRYLN